jgi:cellulose synthase/poly-beta-1,6-N-acetylglucosamine synthase-like glycosyltransferase
LKPPIFSVVIPTFHRPEALSALLKGIAANCFPKDQVEVIVVDDSGSGDLEPVLAPFRECYPVVALRTPHLGPAPARQAGIDIAQGEYLAFTDDDCIPDPNWLAELKVGLEANPGCAIGGWVSNGLPENLFSSSSHIIFEYVVRYHARGEVDYVGTGNVAYPAASFRAIGGLDRTWQNWGGEDRDLCRRWRGSGRRFVVHAAANIRHCHPLTLRNFWNQHVRYGRGASQYHQTSPFSRLGFYWGLIGAGFSGDGRHPRLFTGAAVVLSQVAIGCGFAWERLVAKRAPEPRSSSDGVRARAGQ